MEISRTSQNLHFRVTKKDPGLLIRFHVLNLSKSWSNLGFDQDMIQMRRKLKKSEKNEKPKYIIFKPYKSCIYIPPNPKLCLIYEVKHEEKWLWVSNMEFSKTSQKLHFRVTKKYTCFPFHIHVLNLFKLSWSNDLGFDKIQM